jgi:ER membrane protein complex subunit 1
VATLSGPGGAVLRVFDAQTGVLVTEKRLHSNEDGALVQPRHLGKYIAFDSTSKDVYTLTNGHTVTRVNDKGEAVWSYSAVDKTGQRQYIQLHTTAEALYLVGVTGQTKLSIITLAPTSGEVIAQREFPATILDPAADIFTLSLSKDFVIWVEEGAAKTMPLDPQLSNGKNVALINDRVLAYLVDIGLAKQGEFLAQLMDSSAVLVKLRDDGKALDLVYDLPYKDTGVQYNSWMDTKGQAFSARSYWSDEQKVYLYPVGIFSLANPRALENHPGHHPRRQARERTCHSLQNRIRGYS